MKPSSSTVRLPQLQFIFNMNKLNVTVPILICKLVFHHACKEQKFNFLPSLSRLDFRNLACYSQETLIVAPKLSVNVNTIMTHSSCNS